MPASHTEKNEKNEKNEKITNMVMQHYGNELQSTGDVGTSNACSLNHANIPTHVKEILSMISDEITSKFYGCGVVAPELCEGLEVLDLGSGCGRDSFVLSKLVGQDGHVTGIDMTEDLIKLSDSYIPYHMEKFGYKENNVNFVKGFLEKMSDSGIRDNSYDLLISNGVLNLTADKDAVLKEAYRVLKTGGELYFSDTFTDTQLSDEAKDNKLLWSECISGAHYWPQFVQLALDNGFSTLRVVAAETLNVGCQDLQKIVGDARFVSATCRMFKLPPTISQPAQVEYKGGIPEAQDCFQLDYNTQFKRDHTVSVSSELATILSNSRFSQVFNIQKDITSQLKKMENPIDADPFLIAYDLSH